MTGLFSLDVAVDLAKDRVVFTSDGRSEALVPFVYVEMHGDEVRCVGSGELRGALPENVLQIGLFDGSPLPPFIPDRSGLLAYFLKHGMTTVIAGISLVSIRPWSFAAPTASPEFSTDMNADSSLRRSRPRGLGASRLSEEVK